jgi:YidC/Oxa1 family membrane protein insertase
MERNAILFLVLSISIIVGYSVLFPPAPPTKSDVHTPTTSPAETTGTTATLSGVPDTAPAPGTPSVAASADERTVVVETDLFRAALSTRGAVITSWRLSRYTNGPTKDTPIDLYTTPGEGGASPLAVLLESDDEGLRAAIQSGLYTVNSGDLRLGPDRPTGTLKFETRGPRGETVVKRLTFHHDNYLVDVEVSTWGVSGSYRVVLGENFGIRQWGDMSFVGYIGPTSLIDGKVVQDKPAKLDQPAVHAGRVTWTALQDKYFVTTLIPSAPSSTVVAERFGENRVTIGLREPEPSDGKVLSARLYAGPKEYDRLAALQIGLQETIDFGWFIYGSWALVRLIAEPLFNQELMALYKGNKVNPLGGCLPMLVQIPFFIALFNILYTTIELRQAPFFGWITDLSDKDPYYVLPIVMGITMFIQQKIQPTTMDPTQAKIMLFLPVIFTFFFLAFPAGLVLYWIANNTLTIVQQYVTLRYYKPQPLVIPKGLSA